jgi:hypothetical protein
LQGLTGVTGVSSWTVNRIAALRRRRQRADSGRPLGAEEDRVVPVPPVEDVAGEVRRRDAERLHHVELVLAGGLAVLDPVPGVRPRQLVLGLAEREQDVVDRGVAVAVDRDLVPGPVQVRHLPRQRRPRAERVPAVRRVPLVQRVVRPAQAAGEPLDRPVLQQLDRPDLQLVRVQPLDQLTRLLGRPAGGHRDHADLEDAPLQRPREVGDARLPAGRDDGGRHAAAGVLPDGVLGRPQHVLAGRGRHEPADERGRLLEHAVRLAGGRVLADPVGKRLVGRGRRSDRLTADTDENGKPMAYGPPCHRGTGSAAAQNAPAPLGGGSGHPPVRPAARRRAAGRRAAAPTGSTTRAQGSPHAAGGSWMPINCLREYRIDPALAITGPTVLPASATSFVISFAVLSSEPADSTACRTWAIGPSVPRARRRPAAGGGLLRRPQVVHPVHDRPGEPVPLVLIRAVRDLHLWLQLAERGAKLLDHREQCGLTSGVSRPPRPSSSFRRVGRGDVGHGVAPTSRRRG